MSKKRLPDTGFRLAGSIAFALSGTYGLADIRVAQGRLRAAIATYEGALQLVEEAGGEESTVDMNLQCHDDPMCVELLPSSKRGGMVLDPTKKKNYRVGMISHRLSIKKGGQTLTQLINHTHRIAIAINEQN